MNKKDHKIKIDLEEMMWKNRIKSISELSEMTKISRPTLTRLVKGESERLDLVTLSTLCKILDCEVSDILKYDRGQAS